MRRRAWAATLTALSTLSISASAAIAAETVPLGTREVTLSFTRPSGEPVSSAWANRGTAPVAVQPVAADGGAVRVVAGRTNGNAAAFPAFKSSDPGLAALRVTRRSGDPLSPGKARFRFGVDFKLNATSEGSPVDDGNNLLQRGSYGDVAQYKLQVDQRVVSCRVKGAAGAVMVATSWKVDPEKWFRATCRREGNHVELHLVRLGDGADWVWRRYGTTGAVVAPRSAQPMSVGGKLASDGTLLTKQSDQFNGVLDNAFLNIAR